jgi:multisubunit Na+/H+ antiporter MnhF subunit
MNAWLAAAAVLLGGFVPCGFVALRGSRLDAVVALELATTLATLTLVLVAMGFQRSAYFGVALALAALGFVCNLTFLRFMERGL